MLDISLSERIKSFKNCQKFKKLPIEYALSGFILSDEIKGILTCIFCEKTLADWGDENPYEEHKLHPNNCPLLSLNKRESRERTFNNPDLKYLAQKFFCFPIFDYDTLFCYKCGFYEHFPIENMPKELRNLGLNSKLGYNNLLGHSCYVTSKIFVHTFFLKIQFFENILSNEPKIQNEFDFDQLKDITHLLQYIPMHKSNNNMTLKEVLKKALSNFKYKVKEKMLKDKENLKRK